MLKLIKALNGTMERLTSKQLLLIAVLSNIFITLLFNLAWNGFGSEKAAPVAQAQEIALRKVVVAKVPIPRGTIIDDSMLETVEFAEVSVPDGATQDMRAFQNMPAKVDILPGDVVTEKKVYTQVRQALSGQLPDSSRAITVSINAVTELLNAGDRVDVILVSDMERDAPDEMILKDVLLLGFNNANTAVKGAHQLASAGQSPRGPDVTVHVQKVEATLALKPDEILKVATATQKGTVHLSLKSITPEPTTELETETFYSEPASYVDKSVNYSVPPQEVPVTLPEFTTPTPAAQPSLPIIPSNPAPALPEIPDISALPLPDMPNVPDKHSSGEISGGIEVVEWGK